MEETKLNQAGLPPDMPDSCYFQITSTHVVHDVHVGTHLSPTPVITGIIFPSMQPQLMDNQA